ncbi:MAG: flagellin FliC [Magnetococcales bacterium]|nr:flagellin FliC [Magnetococcales bacterium]
MALNINTNITSLLATQAMEANGKSLAKTFERLITGSRLNRAGDDPAGFSVSQRLTAKIRGSNFAVRNAQDAVSVTQVADAAMQETSNSLQKMRDIMVSVGNPSVTASDRVAMQSELEGLITEIQRIATGTNFNGKKLLNGSYNGQRVLIGAEVTEVLSFSIGGLSKEALGMVLGDTIVSFNGSALTAEELGQNISTNIARIDAAISSVSAIRAKLGAVQNRFNSIIVGLDSLVTATSESRARILDTDMAAEAAEMAKQQIKQQVGAAILSQANQLPSAVLTLLR